MADFVFRFVGRCGRIVRGIGGAGIALYVLGLHSSSSITLTHALVFGYHQALFSMLLTPEADGGAELLLGGIDSSKFKGTCSVWRWPISPIQRIHPPSLSPLSAAKLS